MSLITAGAAVLSWLACIILVKWMSYNIDRRLVSCGKGMFEVESWGVVVRGGGNGIVALFCRGMSPCTGSSAFSLLRVKR